MNLEKSPAIRQKLLATGEPEILQTSLGVYELSWNPDDSRFYVVDMKEEKTLGTFKEHRNAVSFMRTKFKQTQEET